MEKNVLEQFQKWRAFLNEHGYEYVSQEEQEESVDAFFIHRAKDLKLSLRLGGWRDMIFADHSKRFDKGLKFLTMPLPDEKNDFITAETLAFGDGLAGHPCKGCPWFRVAGAEHLRCEKGMKNPYGILGTGGRGWKVGERVRFLSNCDRINEMKKVFGKKNSCKKN